MSLSSGSLEKMGTSTSAMPQGRSMPSPRILPPTSRSTSKIGARFVLTQTNFLFLEWQLMQLRMFIVSPRPILHKYANEDVSLGAWFIGLDVEHIDDRDMCCGTPPGQFLQHLCIYHAPQFLLSCNQSLLSEISSQIVSGKHKQGTFVLRRLTGSAVGSAIQLRG